MEVKMAKIKMTREEYEQVKREYEEAKAESRTGKPEKKIKFFKFGQKGRMNKSNKKPDMIVIFLLNLKRQFEGPILTKIYGGNFLVIRNQVYRYNPGRIFTFGKYKVGIARQFDRQLVGIDDFDDLVVEDARSSVPGTRVNINDPVLIKAVIAAHLSEKQKQAMSAKWIIIGLVILGLVVGAFFLFGGKKAAPTPTK